MLSPIQLVSLARPFPRGGNHRAVALVIVLAFVVLLAGLAVAFFSSSMLYRQISNSSASETKVDLFAQGAVDTIVGDLKQEIAAGSNATLFTDNSGNVVTRVYVPANSNTAVPAQALVGATPAPGVTSYAPNLVKRSAQGQNFFPAGSDPGSGNYNNNSNTNVTVSVSTGPATPNGPTTALPSKRAANVSTTAPSLNGRFVSPARWNKPLLVQKASYTTNGAADTNDTDFTPDPATFYPPDWILTARDGSNPTGAFNSGMITSASGGASVIGRYAYTIYDEGGLLDVNVAGYPKNTFGVGDTKNLVFRNNLAFADLTRLPGISGLTASRQTVVFNSLVGWRNYATAQPNSGTLAGANFNFTGAPLTNFSTAVLSNTNGFLKTGNAAPFKGQTDRMFASRQEMIRLLLNAIATQGMASAAKTDRANLQDALQYLSSFSRSLDQPSYVPAVHASPGAAPKVLAPGSGGTNANGLDREINPSFLKVRTPVAFARNDGSTAAIGDPVVQKRFALQRLAWLTYKGPSANRNAGDPDMAALIANGVPLAYLQLGTDANIAEYFGLTWNKTNKWLYNLHNNSGKGPIMRVGRDPSVDSSPDATHYIQDLATPRDPDFFELLKAALTVGSLGKTLASSNSAVGADIGAPDLSWEPYDYNYDLEASTDRQVMQIGANIIGQSRADNYPVQIDFDDGVGNRNAATGSPTKTTIVGVANLPYLYNVATGLLQVTPPSPLPRSGKDSGYTGANGTGTFGDSGYKIATTAPDGTASPADQFTAPGVGAVMQMPIVWNPHDPSSPVGIASLNPTQFRVVADSTTPDRVGGSSASYGQLFAYGYSSLGSTQYSYQATSASGNSWYSSPSLTGQEIAHPITADNSAILLTGPAAPTLPLLSEPTLLYRASSISDSNGNAITVATGPLHRLSTEAPVSALATGGGLPSYVNPAPGPSWTGGGTGNYLGFYLGAFPWAWPATATGSAPSSAGQSGIYLARYNGTTGGGREACYLTYRMQYMDPIINDWVTYDTKYGKSIGGADTLSGSGNVTSDGSLLAAGGVFAGWVDPRTSRFGMHWNTSKNGPGTNDPVESSWMYLSPVNSDSQGGGFRFINGANGILTPDRPDAQTGYYFMTNWTRTAGMPTATSGWMAFASSDGSSFPGFAPGLLTQNNTDIPYVPSRFFIDQQGGRAHTPNYFADPDGIVRRGMGAFVPYGGTTSPDHNGNPATADTTVGLPQSTAYVAAGTAPVAPDPSVTRYTPGASTSSTALSQAQSRPYFFHRPFHSVAELAEVFSDTPWRNLDLATPESGGAALLDVFCVNETDNPAGMVAGKVNLNTRQAAVMQALLSGVYLDPASIAPTGGVPATAKPMDAATTTLMASALNNYVTANGPLQNVADLVGKWVSNQPIQLTAAIGSTGGTSQGTLNAPFYDGKLSYTGFVGGKWDSANQKPKVTSPAADVYSAYMSATSPFTTTANHNGTQETAVYIQRFRTAPLRALAASGQTRVWNLMIDLVAQTGRYPSTANDLSKFIVEGEQRYWVHLAIDRMTGQVIDKQVEVVKE